MCNELLNTHKIAIDLQSNDEYPGSCWTFSAKYSKRIHPCTLYCLSLHYGDVIMDTTASQITSLTIVYATVYSDIDQRKHQSSASLAFVWGIHRGPVNSSHKWPVTRKMFPFDDVNMNLVHCKLHFASLTLHVTVALKWQYLFAVGAKPFPANQNVKYECFHGAFQIFINFSGSVQEYSTARLIISIMN